MDKKPYKLKKDSKYGYIVVDPKPSEEAVNKFYQEEFYSGEYKHFNDSAKEVQLKDHEYHKMWWKHIWKVLENQAISEVKEKNKTDVIDIGCGFGLFLEYLVCNHNVNGFGYDPAPEAIEYLKSKGINGKIGGLENFNLDKKFDVALLINVLEHVLNPEKTILEIKNKLLNKDGILVIDVPNEFNVLQTTANQHYGLNDWWVAPPGHINYFDLSSLTKLLKKNGYKILKAEASFPLECFLLFGDNYVKDNKIGAITHKKRMTFEKTFLQTGQFIKLTKLYESFAKIGIGRQIRVYARSL